LGKLARGVRPVIDLEKMAREIADGTRPEALRSAILAALREVERETVERAARLAQSYEEAHAECGHDEGYMDGRHDAARAIRAVFAEALSTDAAEPTPKS
jgi:flagellar biosynthesis/type III secretory pathway protein FliH